MDSVTLHSDDDLNGQTETDSLQSGTGASGSRKRKDFLSPKKKGLEKKKDEISELSSSLHSVSMEFGKVFENMNSHLGAMTQIWGGEEDPKKKLDDVSNRILEEVMKLDFLSPSDALEVATILMAEENKLRVFYQATTALKKQYVTDLLRRK